MTDDLNEPAEVHWAQMMGLLILILLLFRILFAATGDPPFSWGAALAVASRRMPGWRVMT
jgi:hypothetical protein